MPEEIVKRCVKFFSFVGDTILDSFTGSGTTLKVAKELKRNYAGYEIMESYKPIIEKTKWRFIMQKDIFYNSTLENNNTIEVKKNCIYNLDVFDFLNNEVTDNSVDLAIIDPPYNMKKADWNTFKHRDDFLNFTFAWINALLPKLKENSSLYIFNTPFNSAYILQFLVDKGLDFKNWIVWNKQDGITAPKSKFVNSSETVLFFTKGKPTFNFNDVREPYKSTDRMKHAAKKGIIKNGKRWFPNPNGRLCSEVWDFSSEA